MLNRTRRLLRRFAILLTVLALALLALRAWDASSGPPLRAWHLVVPPELPIAALEPLIGPATWQPSRRPSTPCGAR